MGCFAPKATPSPPSLVASESEDDDDDDDGDLMEMSALPIKCLLDTLLDTLPFITRDKKGE